MRNIPSTLRFTADDEGLRQRLRMWLGANQPPALPTHDYAARIAALVEWQCDLARAGFVGLSWPKEFGGAGLPLSAEAVFAEELAHTSAPELINRLAVYTWGPTLMQFGTEEQRKRYLPAMLDASELWCQGFSEPGAGSDLAAVSTRAVDDGAEFVVTGQKVWTSRAVWSKWCALLARTTREEKPHAGLSILIVDLRSEGVTVRPLLDVTHEPHFSEVFLEGVRVPKDRVLGSIGDGWRVAMAAMSFERGLFVLERQIRLRKRLDDLARALDIAGKADEETRMLGELFAHVETLRARVYATIVAQSEGRLQPGATSVDKLLLEETDQLLFARAFDALASQSTEAAVAWGEELLRSRGVSIYSGTSQIQRNVIATQLLGLPRAW